MYTGCVSVLLHFSLHAFLLWCLLLYCYMVLHVCCYMNGSLSGHPVQMILLERLFKGSRHLSRIIS